MIPFKELENIDVTNKTVLITGANAGLGFETARYFATHGATVILSSRSLEKGQAACELIQVEAPHAKLYLLQLDLADSKSIERFSSQVHELNVKIDILINNAGIMAVPYALTKDGYESQIGVNHLGHFRLTALLFDVLSDTARIVNISSMAHRQGSVNFNNFMYEKGKYSPFSAYSRSKLCNLLYTEALADHIQANGLSMSVVSAHPGVAKTGLFDTGKRSKVIQFFINLFLASVSTAEEGAQPSIMAALDPQAVNGNFYGPSKNDLVRLDTPIPLAKDKKAQSDLWTYSIEKTKVSYPFS